MADGTQKRPAHEVILDLLERKQREMHQLLEDPERHEALNDKMLLFKAGNETLAEVLCGMVIPEKERGNVLTRLEGLEWSFLIYGAPTGVDIVALITELKGEQPASSPAA